MCEKEPVHPQVEIVTKNKVLKIQSALEVAARTPKPSPPWCGGQCIGVGTTLPIGRTVSDDHVADFSC